jgi:hypothetical protein
MTASPKKPSAPFTAPTILRADQLKVFKSDGPTSDWPPTIYLTKVLLSESLSMKSLVTLDSTQSRPELPQDE